MTVISHTDGLAFDSGWLFLFFTAMATLSKVAAVGVEQGCTHGELMRDPRARLPWGLLLPVFGSMVHMGLSQVVLETAK